MSGYHGRPGMTRPSREVSTNQVVDTRPVGRNADVDTCTTSKANPDRVVDVGGLSKELRQTFSTATILLRRTRAYAPEVFSPYRESLTTPLTT
jgi:hypothetical protein